LPPEPSAQTGLAQSIQLVPDASGYERGTPVTSSHAPTTQKARRSVAFCNLNPTPNTQHPAPCTLHPTPYTLDPIPHTLHPTPYAPHTSHGVAFCSGSEVPRPSSRTPTTPPHPTGRVCGGIIFLLKIKNLILAAMQSGPRKICSLNSEHKFEVTASS